MTLAHLESWALPTVQGFRPWLFIHTRLSVAPAERWFQRLVRLLAKILDATEAVHTPLIQHVMHDQA